MTDEKRPDNDGLEDENENFLHPEWRVFAHAYADPTSATYTKKPESYRVAFPLPPGQEETQTTRASAQRSAYRLLEREVVQEEIERIRQQIRGGIGMTKEDYLMLLKKREEKYAKLAEAEVKGASQASAAILKLIGTAIGALVQLKEDRTPPERRRIGPGETADRVLAAAERIARLRQPTPSPLDRAEPTQVMIVEKPRCKWCDGRRLSDYDAHWSGEPTCKPCDAMLNAERRRRERESLADDPPTE